MRSYNYKAGKTMEQSLPDYDNNLKSRARNFEQLATTTSAELFFYTVNLAPDKKLSILYINTAY
jgi:hypothetical protein